MSTEIMMMEPIRPALALDPALIERVAELQSTAEYIATLADIIRHDVDRMRGALTEQPAEVVRQYDDWRQIEVLFNLMDQQVRIVTAAALAVEAVQLGSVE